MNKMTITMITGKARSGKSTYANKLAREIRNSEVLAFADQLKLMARMMGWNGVKDLKGRTFLQHLGDVVNDYDNTFWASYVCYMINDIKNTRGVDDFIISDLRYDHEYQVVVDNFPKAKFKVIQIDRQFETNLSDEQQQHPSELGVSEDIITEKVVL